MRPASVITAARARKPDAAPTTAVFVTAPELSPLFAQTLAQPVAEALAASGTRSVMEFGAGPERFDGVVVGNEVLDAMPVRLFAKAGGAWQERGVALDARQAFVFEDRPATGRLAATRGPRRCGGWLRDRDARGRAGVHAHRLHDARARRGAAGRLRLSRARVLPPAARPRHADVPLPSPCARRSVPVPGAAGHHRVEFTGIYDAAVATAPICSVTRRRRASC